MEWTLAQWHEVQSRLEHAMQVPRDSAARFALLKRSIRAAAAEESGFSALEALAWSLRCLQSVNDDHILAVSDEALAINLVTTCLRIGDVSQSGHPLSVLHAELLEYQSRTAERHGKAFVAFWRQAQAYLIRQHAEPARALTPPEFPNLQRVVDKPIAFVTPHKTKRHALEAVLWALAQKDPLSPSKLKALEESGFDLQSSLAWRGPLGHFVRQLHLLTISQELMGSPVDNMCDFLATMADIVPANVELLVWGATARVFAARRLHVFSDFCWLQYRELSLVLSQPGNPDLLALAPAS